MLKENKKAETTEKKGIDFLKLIEFLPSKKKSKFSKYLRLLAAGAFSYLTIANSLTEVEKLKENKSINGNNISIEQAIDFISTGITERKAIYYLALNTSEYQHFIGQLAFTLDSAPIRESKESIDLILEELEKQTEFNEINPRLSNINYLLRAELEPVKKHDYFSLFAPGILALGLFLHKTKNEKLLETFIEDCQDFDRYIQGNPNSQILYELLSEKVLANYDLSGEDCQETKESIRLLLKQTRSPIFSSFYKSLLENDKILSASEVLQESIAYKEKRKGLIKNPVI